MSLSLDQILPSLQALGVLGYWLIGLGAMLEAFFLTGVVVPGTLIVDAGGVLVQRGLLDFFDLVWFVAIGAILGSELSYWTGKLAMNRLPGRQRIGGWATFARATRLFNRRGGMALVIGRFLGPVAGLVPLAAGMAGMGRRQFLIWNIAGSIPYAFAHVAIGYFLGDVMGRIGGSLTRVAVLVGSVALLLIVLWGTLYSALRLLPLAWAVLSVAIRTLADSPAIARRIEAHPHAARWAVARFDRNAFVGLPLSLLGVIFIYIGAVWLDSVIEFVAGDAVLQLDLRLAGLIHPFQAPMPIRIASWFTAAGGWQVVLPLVAASLLWLLLTGRRALAAGLAVSVVGNTVSVALLKLAFGRPRSPLGVFAETSGSFPSGHAAASIAAYGMIMYMIWRAGKLRAETALLLAGVIALAIGISRIYLIEHYLSDVLNGWLVGALWLTVGVAVAEWQLSKVPATGPSTTLAARGRVRAVGVGVVLGLVAVAAMNVARYDHPRNAPIQTADKMLASMRDLAAIDGPPLMTESLMGTPVHPVSVVVFAKDRAALFNALSAAGWIPSKPTTPGLVFDALYAALAGSEDPTVDTVSHFWRGQPNSLAFVAGGSPSKGAAFAGPKARFWRTEFVTRDGVRAFVGTVGFDDAGDVGAERSAAKNTAARDGLAQSLRSNGARVAIAGGLPGQAGGAVPRPQSDVVVLSLR